MRTGLATLFLMPFALACSGPGPIVKDRGAAGIFENAPTVNAPKSNRCTGKPPALQSQCEEARYLARNYARRLSTGDSICREGGFGSEPITGCLARAAVVDTAPNRVLIEIRSADPQSSWFSRVQHQLWFEEDALVDLYLAENGY